MVFRVYFKNEVLNQDVLSLMVLVFFNSVRQERSLPTFGCEDT